MAEHEMDEIRLGRMVHGLSTVLLTVYGPTILKEVEAQYQVPPELKPLLPVLFQAGASAALRELAGWSHPQTERMIQLGSWVADDPYHDGQHVPDMSCCHPELLAPLKERVEFVTAEIRNDLAKMTELHREFQKRFVQRSLRQAEGANHG